MNGDRGSSPSGRDSKSAAARDHCLAAFDFDETLTTGDTVIPFMRRFARDPRVVARATIALPRLLAAAARRDRDAVRAVATQIVFRGVAHRRVQAEGVVYAAELLDTKLRADTLERLRWHLSENHRVVIVSASYRDYLQPLADNLGVDEVLSTQLEVDDRGTCTGALDGPNCRGPEKVRRLNDYMQRLGLVRADTQIWAYGDSSGDRELLAFADYPTWVTTPVDKLGPS